MNCINCGKPTTKNDSKPVMGFRLCNGCQDDEQKMMDVLDGAKIAYDDGTKEILRYK